MGVRVRVGVGGHANACMHMYVGVHLRMCTCGLVAWVACCRGGNSVFVRGVGYFKNEGSNRGLPG